MKLILKGLYLFLFLHSCSALKCYTCRMSGGDKDNKCLKNPALVTTSPPITNCNKKYCTIIRIDNVDTGEVYSFSRDCESNPHKDGIVTDSSFKTYFTSCKTALCNTGDGHSPGGGSGNGGGDADDDGIITDDSGGKTYIVPGIGSLSSIIIPSFFIIIISYIFVICYS